jgi:uncharacterized membrane protein YkvA (DUF1232 family)
MGQIGRVCHVIVTLLVTNFLGITQNKALYVIGLVYVVLDWDIFPDFLLL